MPGKKAPHGSGKMAKAVFDSLDSICDVVGEVKEIFYKDGKLNTRVSLNERYKAQRLIRQIRESLADLDEANDDMIKANNQQRLYQLEHSE